MASDLSSGCTEVNDILDDEKEEGEISLEDVSSSEEGPTYKYLPRAFGQCAYCLSMQHCATWCRSLTINKHNIKRDAGLQGKENRRRRFHKDGFDVSITGGSSSSKSIPYSSSTLQEKNDDDVATATVNNDLVPISSDSDMEVVGLTCDKRDKKSNRRRTPSSRKLRKKRRKKSPDSLSLSLSPSSQDITLSIKDSIHRIEKEKLESGHSKYRHHSPIRKRPTSKPLPSIRRHNHSPISSRPFKRRLKLPLRKTSPLHPRKLVQRKPSIVEPINLEELTVEQPSSRGNVTKLLKKVRKLEPFSSRIKEKGSSLKDKLNNIIKHDKKDPSTIIENNKNLSAEPSSKEEPNVIVKDEVELVKEPITEEKKDQEVDDEEDIVVLREIALKTKLKKNTILLKPEEIKTEPIDQPVATPPPPEEPPPPAPSPPPPTLSPLGVTSPLRPVLSPLGIISPTPSETDITKTQSQQQEHKLPNFCMDDNDEDLELRMIALRSAVLKKHRSRVANGKRKKPEASVPRMESPFTSTFIEDFPLLAEICSPSSPVSSKRDILLAEDMELDSDMELSGSENQSPYSPSDDITGELLLEHEVVKPVPITPIIQPVDQNGSLYSPSNPTGTPAFAVQNVTKQLEKNTLNGSLLEFTNQESRPYSPSDATVYDPDLPGVHSSVPSASCATTTTTMAPPPLQPPPLPPMSMFGSQQPILLGCPSNLVNAYNDPIAIVPPPMVTSFPSLHQSVNPLLLPSATPLFAYPTPSAAPVPAPTLPPPLPSMTMTSEMDDFMETDLDGSPLVAIEKDSNSQKWPLLSEPLYLQNELTQSELSKLPALTERSLVPAAVLRSNKQLQKQPAKKPVPLNNETLFRNAEMRPVTLDELDARTRGFKPIKLQAQPKKSVTTQPAAAFDSALDDTVENNTTVIKTIPDAERKKVTNTTEKEEKEKLQKSSKVEEKEKEKVKNLKEEERDKNKKREINEKENIKSQSTSKKRETDLKHKINKSASRQSSRETRSTRRSSRDSISRRRSSLRLRDRSSRLSRTRSVSKTKNHEVSMKTETSKNDDLMRRNSIEEDEVELREILLASLAKRLKEKPADVTPLKPVETSTAAKTSPPAESIPKSTDEMPLAERVSAFLAKNKQEENQSNATTTAKMSAVTKLQSSTTSQLKRLADPASLTTQQMRKIVKRVINITPASKVVNNAKRFQNLMVQRKLVQQMVPAAIKSRFKLNHNPSTQTRSESPIIAKPKSEFQKIIINLNEDTESESEEETKSKSSPTKIRAALEIPTTDFEKSVDQFLKNVRQQQEMASAPSKNNVDSPAPDKPSMGPPSTKAMPSVIKTVTANTNQTITKNAVATSAVISGVITTTTNCGTLGKDKIVVSTPKILKITTKTPTINATPTAVKHLTASQQEEYRRLKQQISEREKLKRLKAIESAPIEKNVTNSTSSPSSSSSTSSSTSSSPALATSTPKAASKVAPIANVVSSPLVQPHEQLLPQSKIVSKTQLVATIKPMSKPTVDNSTTSVVLSKQPPIVNSTKITHTIPTTSQYKATLSKTASVVSNTSVNKNNIMPSPKIAVTTSKVSPQSSNSLFVNKQAALLGKMNEALSSQNKQISAVAQKVSSLRILTKEQISIKTSQIQKTKLSSEINVSMDDLNNKTTGNNKPAAIKSIIDTNKPQSIQSVITNASKDYSKMNTLSGDNTNNVPLETSSTADKSKQNWNDFKDVVNEEVHVLSSLPTNQQKKLLSKTEENLIEKRRSVVDDIAEMSLKLREWEIERDLQNKLAEDIKKLQEELKKLEEKQQQQKNKLNTIHPQVSQYHKRINDGRKECFRLSKICNGLGQQIVGPDYKVPTAGAEQLNNKIKEVVKHTQKLQNKKAQYIDTVKNNNSTKIDNSDNNKNSKFNTNPLFKQKEIVKKQNLNNKFKKFASDSINIIGAPKDNESLILNNNKNTCVNVKNIVNPKIEIDQMDTNIENVNMIVDNITETVNSSLLIERLNAPLPPINNSNLETKANNILKTILTDEHSKNFETKNLLNNVNNSSNIEKTKNVVIPINDNVLQETDNSTLPCGNIENTEIVLENNSLNRILTIGNAESNSENVLTISNLVNSANENINNSNEQRSLIKSNDGISILKVSINTAKNFLNEEEIELNFNNSNLIETNIATENASQTNNSTNSTVSIPNIVIKTENENTIEDNADSLISNQETTRNEDVSMEIYEPKTDHPDAPLSEPIRVSTVQKMKLDSEIGYNLLNVAKTVNTNNGNNISINNFQFTETKEEVHGVKIKLENEDHMNNTPETNNIFKEVSSIEMIPVSESEIESNRKKTCNGKRTIRKKPTKAQQQRIYNKRFYRQMQVAQNKGQSEDNSKKKIIRPYESILKHLNVPRNNKTDGILCPFELMGTCNDGDCQYIHQSTSHCQ